MFVRAVDTALLQNGDMHFFIFLLANVQSSVKRQYDPVVKTSVSLNDLQEEDIWQV